LGDDLNLGVRGNHARQPEYAPVKVLQSLLLLELRVQREDRQLQRFEQRDEASNTVNRSHKNERSTGIPQ
jgi:hypothetical protein